jgi:hypothetical protein
MIRRQFLKVLGLAPVAAPALAKMAESEEVTGILHGPIGGGMCQPAAPSIFDESSYVTERLRECRAELARIALGREDRLQSYIESIRRDRPRLDPDLAAMRSFSASALVQLQAERSARRALAREERSLLERIKELLEQSR